MKMYIEIILSKCFPKFFSSQIPNLITNDIDILFLSDNDIGKKKTMNKDKISLVLHHHYVSKRCIYFND